MNAAHDDAELVLFLLRKVLETRLEMSAILVRFDTRKRTRQRSVSRDYARGRREEVVHASSIARAP